MTVFAASRNRCRAACTLCAAAQCARLSTGVSRICSPAAAVRSTSLCTWWRRRQGSTSAAVADSIGEGFSRVLHAAQVQVRRTTCPPRLPCPVKLDTSLAGRQALEKFQMQSIVSTDAGYRMGRKSTGHCFCLASGTSPLSQRRSASHRLEKSPGRSIRAAAALRVFLLPQHRGCSNSASYRVSSGPCNKQAEAFLQKGTVTSD